MKITVRLAKNESILVVPVPSTEGKEPFVFLEIAKGDEGRSVFLGPKELDRLMSALQRAVRHIRSPRR